MKYPLSWATAWLAALLHFHSLCCGGAVSLKRNQPQAGVVRQLRAALDSRTEELTQQKNIAHGLELEVRELQSELQAEKKALTTETQKEQTLQQKLNRVRAVLDDGSTAKTGKRGDKGSSAASPVAAPMMAPMSDDIVVPVAPKPLSQSIEVTVNAPPIQESLEALPNVPDSELEPLDEIPAPQLAAPLSKPVPPTRQLTPQSSPTVETRQLTAQSFPVTQESAAAVHTRQTTPQEPPPFFEAAALQSSSMIKAAPAKKTVKAAKATDREVKTAKATPTNAVEATDHSMDDALAVLTNYHGANSAPARKTVAKKVAAKTVQQPSKAKPAPAIPALRGTEPAAKPAAVVPASKPLAEAAPLAASMAAPTGGASDFDALEAQLHEEDRRIQDLDRENELDSMTGGSSPPANNTSMKTAASQPALEMEAPMEDIPNFDAPSALPNEAAAASAAPSDASLGDAGLSLPQVDAADGALSDNQFLAQIAPGKK